MHESKPTRRRSPLPFAARLLSALALGCIPPWTFAATPDEIDAAIAKGVAFLYSRPDFVANGNWEEAQKQTDKVNGNSQTGAQWGGRTSLVTYALLASGESANHPKLKPAVDFLRKSDAMIGYYALGLRPQVWLYLPQTTERRQLAARDFRQLWAGIEKDMSKRDGGLYDYVLDERVMIDLSVSQYGVLGMWACEQLGVEVPSGRAGNYWQMVETRWRGLQDDATGGWAYRGDAGVTPSMTAAGVATLFITQDYLRTSQGLNCQGNQKSPEIDRGIDYMAKHLPAIFSAQGVSDQHYTIYGVERIGVASGLKYFNDVDWYQTGAEFLVRSQRPDGSWAGDHDDEIPTSFALLFLSRGREPVMMNKLKYDLAPATATAKPTEGFWNQRSRDVANATRYVGKQMERMLNWQILDMSVATAADLRDAPIAYVSGSQAVTLKPEQLARLKQFVEEGGTLVFNVDCGRRQFATAIPKLMATLFPYEFRPLPESHPIFRNQQFRGGAWKRRPSIQGLSNGVRELALILDDDLGKSFQTNDFGRTPEHFELMANIYQYAIDKKNAKVKGRSHVVEINPGIVPTASIKLARLKHGGNWNPEPGGWRQFKAVMHNTQKIDVKIGTVDLAVDELTGYHAAHLTGTGVVKLSDDAIRKLKAFVEAGGLLIVDAAGGNGEFATAIEAQLGQVAPAAKDGGTLIPPIEPIYAPAPLKVPEFRYRAFTQATVGISSAPRVRGAKVGDRYGVIYSPDDLSGGLVGNEVDGVRGYTPACATDIMTRLLIYARTAKTGTAATRPSASPAK